MESDEAGDSKLAAGFDLKCPLRTAALNAVYTENLYGDIACLAGFSCCPFSFPKALDILCSDRFYAYVGAGSQMR